MLSARKLVAALKKAGFHELHQKGSHLFMHHPDKDLLTCVPMHSGDIGRGLVRVILQDIGLSEEQFRALL
jgi:predicted RNA binding protein YcfA (HicA-like mRNA interferase family)